MYLDSIAPVKAEIGFARLGLRGQLGYKGKVVAAQGQCREHALSSHSPSRLGFRLGGRITKFQCRVALNDDVPKGASHTDFILLADAREVATERLVQAGEPPRWIEASIAGTELLELVVRTARQHSCHALWIDPQVEEAAVEPPATLVDCLGRAEVRLPATRPRGRRCIATVVSPSFANLLDDMLGSLYANSNCHDSLVVLFAFDADDLWLASPRNMSRPSSIGPLRAVEFLK